MLMAVLHLAETEMFHGFYNFKLRKIGAKK